MASVKEEVRKEALRIGEDALYSAKGHFEHAAIWRKVHLWVGLPSAVLAAIAGVSALARFDNSGLLAGSLAIVVAAATAVSTFLNPEARATAHAQAGNKLLALHEKARLFAEIDVRMATEDSLVQGLKGLAAEKAKLNEDAPGISRWAYERAKRGIEAGEATHEADK